MTPRLLVLAKAPVPGRVKTRLCPPCTPAQAAGIAAAALDDTLAAARRAAATVLALDIADRRFGWPLEMVLRAAAAGWRIREVDVPYRPRAGRSKVTGTVRGTVRAVRDMGRVLAA